MKRHSACIACFVVLSSATTWANQNSPTPRVIPAVQHTLAPPLRDIGPIPSSEGGRQVIPFRPTMTMAPPPRMAGFKDPALQPAPTLPTPTTNLLNFDGIAADGFAPPDTNGSVGATQFEETVNVEFAVYDKNTGALTFGPSDIQKTLLGSVGGVCQTGQQSDPIVLYDKIAGRWLIAEVIFTPTTFTDNAECVAVSTSSDATGSYNVYEFDFGGNLNDYPKFGVWPDAYYYSSNTFTAGTVFAGAQACAFDRANMLLGNPATAICFQQSNMIGTLLPADLDGTTLPPAGETNFYVGLNNFVSPSTSLNFFKFHVDFTNPSNSTFTGPTLITVKQYIGACDCAQSACIPQPAPGELLDSLGDRVMHRLSYRNLGTYESLLVNHSIVASTATNVAAVRWYEIRSPSTTPVVFQQGTFGGSNTMINDWMGSIAQDKKADIALGYSFSSATVDPSVQYTGRLSTDKLGTMRMPVAVVKGTGVQIATMNRWGDYSSMSVDPSDDCTMWYSQEYYKTTGMFGWSTRIVKFKFTSCL